MSRLAMYEQNEGKEDVRLSKYFRTDYVRLNVLKTVVAVTVGYLLTKASMEAAWSGSMCCTTR